MPALPLKPAAAELGISVSKLRRFTAGGAGKIKQGARGRGRATLYDTHVLAELLPRQTGQKRKRRSPIVAAQLLRGDLALTVSDAVIDEWSMATVTGDLYTYGVPSHMQAKLIRYFLRRTIGCITDHLGIEIKSLP